MSKIDTLLSMKKLPDEDDLDITYEDLTKLYWKCKGLLLNEQRNNAFWKASNENLSLAYEKLDKQEREITELYEILKNDMDLAASIQKRMFPKELPVIKNYSMGATCKMAQESGGDFYDVIQLDGHKSLLIIGDVCGKGLPASLYMSSCINIIRALVEEIPSGTDFLTKILEKTNKLLFNIMNGDSFITLYLVLLDPLQHTISYLSLGHMPAFEYNPRKKSLKVLNTPGIVCGIMETAPFADMVEERILTIEKGNFYFLYTDGITDSQSPAGVALGDRFETLITKLSGSESAEEAVDFLLREIAAYTGDTPQFDDLTLLCFKREH